MPIEIVRPDIWETLEVMPGIIKSFAKECEHLEPDTETIQESTKKLWNYQITILAKKDNVVAGAIQGVLIPHIWNKNILAAQEMLFYVKPDFRGSSVAMRLIRAYEDLMKEIRPDMSSLSLMAWFSPTSLPKVYNKMGYSLSEQTYLKKNI
jgi:GNAT superfamily N-acetyltransferase